jgi:hypothetical protein
VKNKQVGVCGHARLSPSVYGNNPPSGGKRMGKANVVWEVVKHLKEFDVVLQ